MKTAILASILAKRPLGIVAYNNEMLDIAEEVLSTCNRQGFVGTEFPKCIIRTPAKYQHINIGTYCAAAKDFFVIGPSGEIRVCNHSPRIVGNINHLNEFKQESLLDCDYFRYFVVKINFRLLRVKRI